MAVTIVGSLSIATAIQRGVLLQVLAGQATFSIYAFNPDDADRYATFALGLAL
jgi:hypothetical protein